MLFFRQFWDEDTPEGTASQSDGFGTQAEPEVETNETENNFMSSTQVEGGGVRPFQLEEDKLAAETEDSEPDRVPQLVARRSEVHSVSELDERETSVPARRELGARQKEPQTTRGKKSKNTPTDATADNTELGVTVRDEVHFCDGCGFIGSDHNKLHS